MINGRIKIIRLLYFIWILLAATQLKVQSASSDELFPVPEKLRTNVRFWIDIYSRFNTWDMVVHDSYFLSVIYEVVDTRKLSGVNSYKEMNLRVEAIKDRYAQILEKISESQFQDINQFSDAEKRVIRIWGGLQNRHQFAAAAKRLRAQAGQRDRFEKGLKRTGAYLDEIRKIFAQHELPQELTLLPLVESAFNPKAYSRLGAAGLWQFTHYTGKLFLTISYEVDERMDPIKSTDAAARLLKLNYQELGTWPLAITAYNHGLAGMRRAKTVLGTDDFNIIATRYESGSFKFASRNFYSEFLAAKHVFENYRRYFGEVEFDSPFVAEKIILADNVKLSTLSNQYNLDLETIKEYNPALRQSVLNDEHYVPRNFEFRLPRQTTVNVAEIYQQIPAAEKHELQVRTRYYRVRPGDNISRIAQKMNTNETAILTANNFAGANIYPGQIIKIPEATSLLVQADSGRSQTREKPVLLASLATSPVEVTNTVRSAEQKAQDKVVENLVSELQTPSGSEKNGNRDLIGPLPAKLGETPEPVGVELTTPVAPATDNNNGNNNLFQFDIEKPVHNTTMVLPEETLGHFAAWLKIPTQKLRQLNNMVFGQEIRVRQHIRLSFESVSLEEFHQQRLEYHKGIQEDFFAVYKIDGTQTHIVKDGENIWDICSTRYEIPLWLVMQYNQDRNLYSLKKGDKLVIPVVVEKA